MGGYRVRVESEDPLAVDEGLCRSQRFQQGLLVHTLLTVCTIGIWAPVLVGWLALSSGAMTRFAAEYTITVKGGMLVAGNRESSRSVPLDAVADVAVNRGFVTVSVRGASPLSLYGLHDPTAAARTILEAREEHLRGVRADVREQVIEAEVGATGQRTGAVWLSPAMKPGAAGRTIVITVLGVLGTAGLGGAKTADRAPTSSSSKLGDAAIVPP
jgi:hypothetical protein